MSWSYAWLMSRKRLCMKKARLKVVGLKLVKAKARIKRAHCRTGRISRRYSTQRQKNRVLRQRPRKGTRLANGGKVNLIVGRGPRR